MSKRARAPWLILLLIAASAMPAVAQREVDLQLVLAVDASGSVNRFASSCRSGAMWRRSAMRVLQESAPARNQAIAATMVQWTGPGSSSRWSDGAASGTANSGGLRRCSREAPRQLFGGGTSISGAIDLARRCLRKIRFAQAGVSSMCRATAPTTGAAR